jgi:hypothetical protein
MPVTNFIYRWIQVIDPADLLLSFLKINTFIVNPEKPLFALPITGTCTFCA